MAIDGSKDQMQIWAFFSRLWTEDGMCQITPEMHAKILHSCRGGRFASGRTPLPLGLWLVGGKINYMKLDRERRQFERAFIEL